MAGFTLVGGINYINDIINGNTLDPFASSTESSSITTLKKFDEDLDAASKQNWEQLQTDINRLDTSYRALYGKSVFTDNYQNDLKEFKLSLGPPMTAAQRAVFDKAPKWIQSTLLANIQPTAEQRGLFFMSELNKSQDYMFQRDHRADFENRSTVVGKEMGDIANDLNAVKSALDIQAKLDALLPSYIDPSRVQGNYKDVPHTKTFTDQVNSFVNYDKSGLSGKILDYVKANPTLFNAAKIREAIQYQDTFMQNVVKNWDIETTGKSFAQGDYIGGLKQMTIDGVQVSENIVKDAATEAATLANDILDSDLNPTKDIWDFIKDLFENASDYIEYIVIAGAAIGLLFIAGQIKTITS